MGRRSIRLGSTISFNEETEADIISKIEYLTSRHMLGDFISNVLRVAFESPDKLESKTSMSKAISEISASGMTKDRVQFFSSVSKEIEEMKAKVDKMYDMNLKLLCLAECGKHMGIEDKTKNSLRAQFVLERQLEDLTSALGLTHATHVFNSNKVIETEEKAKDIFKFILETYDGVLTELKEDVFKEIELKLNNIQVSGVVAAADTTADTGKDIHEEESKDNGDDIVDFGNADMAALGAFLNM